MSDDEITLCNICTDLVSSQKAEAFPRHVLQNERPGDWVCVREGCERIGIPTGDLKPEVFATWLSDPMANDGYAVILFYDDESKWTLAAHYNRERLLGDATPNESLAPISAARLVSPGPKSLEAAPAGEL